jgi:hypothetical protein
MFKKVILFTVFSTLLLVLIVALAACGASSGASQNQPQNEVVMKASTDDTYQKTSQNKSQRKIVWETVDGSTPDEDCQELLTHRFSLLPAQLVAVEKRSLALSAFPSVRLEGGENDGVSIKGWDQSEIALKACKLGAAIDRRQALEVLNQVSVVAQNGEISTRGPGSSTGGRKQYWGVQFILYVPKNLQLELSTHNGDILLRNLEGGVSARTENGGITLSQCGQSNSSMDLHAQNGGISLSEVRGRIKARTTNGGITLAQGSGEVKLQTENGGINIRLPRGIWQGEGLEAKSGNGGLTLEVPSGFGSTIEAETLARTSLECLIPGCTTQDSDRDRRRVRIGDSSPLVRVSTANGDLRIVPAR